MTNTPPNADALLDRMAGYIRRHANLGMSPQAEKLVREYDTRTGSATANLVAGEAVVYPDSICEAHSSVTTSEPVCLVCMQNEIDSRPTDAVGEDIELRLRELRVDLMGCLRVNQKHIGRVDGLIGSVRSAFPNARNMPHPTPQPSAAGDAEVTAERTANGVLYRYKGQPMLEWLLPEATPPASLPDNSAQGVTTAMENAGMDEARNLFGPEIARSGVTRTAVRTLYEVMTRARTAPAASDETHVIGPDGRCTTHGCDYVAASVGAGDTKGDDSGN